LATVLASNSGVSFLGKYAALWTRMRSVERGIPLLQFAWYCCRCLDIKQVISQLNSSLLTIAFMCASQLRSLDKVIPSSLKVARRSMTPDCIVRQGKPIGCLARQPRTISFELFKFMIILLTCDHVLSFAKCCIM